jgi:cobalt-zinc-cadmium resistance protein CzcA
MEKNKKLAHVILSILLLTTTPAIAQQTITLEQAVAMAKENSPRLKSAEASIEVARAGRGASWELGATAVDYSWGQLNSPIRNDRELSIVQPIGSIITPFYKNALIERQVATGLHFREIVEKEITAEVTRAWVYYLYTRSLVQMYSELNDFAEQLLRAGELRHTIHGGCFLFCYCSRRCVCKFQGLCGLQHSQFTNYGTTYNNNVL